MTLPIIFMYSGQGSQYYQMGRSLYEENAYFKICLNQVDQLCIDIMGSSIIKHLYDKTNTSSIPFTKTTLTYPAIFCLEYALTQVMLEKNILPSAVLGSSMGSFAACVAANILSLESALQSLITQAQLLEKHSPEGGMLAIIHDTQFYQAESYLHNLSELAAVNFNSHFVVSGLKENLATIENHLRQNTITHQTLPVLIPFHSSYINDAEPYLLDVMQKINIEKPKVPFLSCAHAGYLNEIQPIYFWEMIRKPIEFQNTIQFLENREPSIYLDLGPSGTLATFVKYNLSSHSSSRFYSILTPYGKDVIMLENVLHSLK